MSRIAWSFSRLNDFEQCPRMFQGKYILKDFPKENFNSPHLQRGKDVHKELEDAIGKGTPLHPSRQWIAPVIEKIRASSMIKAELQVCFNARRKMCSWFDKQAWCRMIFDLICASGEEHIVMIDWKTGKVRTDSTDQLRMFTAGVFDMHPKAQKVTTAYVFVDHPTAPMVYVEYTRDQLEAIWQEFGDRSELIQLANESGNWPEKPTYKCMFCPAEIGQCSQMTPELKEKRRKFENKRG